MKRNTNICIFLFVILLFVILLLFFGTRYNKEPENTEQESLPATEEVTETKDLEAVVESGKEEANCNYIIRSDEGRLTVYLSDGCTLYMNTGISARSLPVPMQEQAKDNGIRFSTEQELMDFLESYSS